MPLNQAVPLGEEVKKHRIVFTGGVVRDDLGLQPLNFLTVDLFSNVYATLKWHQCQSFITSFPLHQPSPNRGLRSGASDRSVQTRPMTNLNE